MDNERALVLYEEGKPLAKIAEAMGVTSPEVNDLLATTDESQTVEVVRQDRHIRKIRRIMKLKGQLATPTYEFRNGKILIESKAEIKKRLGNSPDRADAYVNGLYALQFVEGQLIGGRRDRYDDDFGDDFDDEPYGGNYSAMAM